VCFFQLYFSSIINIIKVKKKKLERNGNKYPVLNGSSSDSLSQKIVLPHTVYIVSRSVPFFKDSFAKGADSDICFSKGDIKIG
jgi:hypothetical protein